MTTFRHRLLQRRFAWLLWIALLLPLAEGAAAWHALSHARAEVAGGPDGKALHAFHCDLCLTAAAVTGGALPSVPLAMPALPVREAAPASVDASGRVAPPASAYRSRAPPFASH